MKSITQGAEDAEVAAFSIEWCAKPWAPASHMELLQQPCKVGGAIFFW